MHRPAVQDDERDPKNSQEISCVILLNVKFSGDLTCKNALQGGGGGLC